MARPFSKRNKKHLVSPERLEARERLKALLPEGEKPVAISEYNLNFENDPVFGILALTMDTVYMYDGEKGGRSMPVKSLTDIKTVQYVGCIAVEYGAEGERAELCRSNMTNGENLRRFVKRAAAINENRHFEVGDAEKEIACPKCGKPYRPGSSKCDLCADKKSLYGRLLKYVKPYVFPITIAIFLYFANSGLRLLSPLLQKKLVDGYINSGKPFSEISGGFYTIVGLMVLTALAVVVARLIRSVIMIKVGNKVAVKLRSLVFAAVNKMSLGDVHRRTAGEPITRVTSDTQVLKDFLTNLVPELFQYGILLITTLTILFTMDARLALFILVPVPLLLVTFRMVRRYTHRLYRQQWRANSAVNTVLWAMNNLRDTMHSHDRVSLLEVMGRHCGDIALYAGVAGGAEYVLVPEIPYDLDEIASSIKKSSLRGKISNLIVLAEGAGNRDEIAKKIEEKSGTIVKVTNFGYIQRGGSPTMQDRILAARFGDRAVEILMNDGDSCALGIKDNKIITMPFEEIRKCKKTFDKKLYDIAHALSL